ncbi:hypothetical protein F5141DRAFT_1068178 [Pisolithus sp. B1]|nr:hypothetical protein F5141DRAFT_1068178 [Pisolithus sp. B1]
MQEPIYLYWHDALEVMWDIFGNPSFSEHMMYDPYYIYEHTKHEYGEWMSGDEAHQIQNELPDGATIVPIILASDKALVMRMSGDCEMHTLFLTIVNINSEVHMKAKVHAWACMVYTLIPEFLTHPNFHSILEASNDHLYHQSQFGNAFQHTPHDGQLTLKTLHDIQWLKKVSQCWVILERSCIGEGTTKNEVICLQGV